MKTISTLAAVLLLSGCSETTVPDEQAATDSNHTYDVDVRWTSHGIPHVKAEDWGSLGYGFAYATATDAVCVIARDVVMVNGRLSEHFGSADGNLESDVFHKAVLTNEKLVDYSSVQSPRSKQFSAGYVAGYNRYLADHRVDLPASCRGEPWVVDISEADLTRLTIGVGIRYGLGRYQKEIANAAAGDDAERMAGTAYELPEGIGSNAVAVGKDLSASGRGILLGNPHYPWHGSSRFHLIHTTIPGELDVMGTSLLTTSRVGIGFNNDVAWTHTVSTALRSTMYRLELNPENPYEYLYDGEYRALEPRQITVASVDDAGKVDVLERTVHFSHYGPVLENAELPWSDSHAYTLRDAVLNNYQTADTYDALNKASSTAEVEAAISLQGIYWVNTIAADRHGNALYADISGTPNVDSALLDQCRIEVEDLPGRVVVLDGATSACEWRDDPRSKVPGALPPAEMPRISRTDFVTNSNDSYWLSNPHAPLEGYSPIIGNERAERSLRTRAGLTLMEEMIATQEKLTPADVQNMLYSHRNYGAELLLDDVLKACSGDASAQACSVLAKWDRTMTVDSRGGHLWREFMTAARDIEDFDAVPFDPSDPVQTPRGVNVADETVAAAVNEALVTAAQTLVDAGIALDAPLGEIQYAERNGVKIPIPGGEGWAGMFSMIVTKLDPETGYNPIVHGNSYIQVVSWDEAGQLDSRAMLTYSQSPEPESAYYSDLTEIYSQGGWIDLPFTEEQIEADPNLRRLRLTQ